MKKGIVQLDYILAIGIFILLFAIVVQTLLNSFSTAQATSEAEALTTRAFGMMSIADFGQEPPNWTGSGNIDRIGLQTRAYRFLFVVNNTSSFLINQSDPVVNLTNELVEFNYSEMGFSYIDVNSTYILDVAANAEVVYNIDIHNITFRTNVAANEAKYFMVYFDDDSNFTSRSASVTGNNNISETAHAVYPVSVLQYRKIQALDVSNYTSVRNSLISDDFNITIENLQISGNIIDYGAETPRSGNVVALQRYFLTQNSTAGIRQGRIIVRTF